MSMLSDYTINDAYHDGFECGLLYIFRYAEEEYNQLLSDDDTRRLVQHLAEKKPWKSAAEWEELINSMHKKYPIRRF